MRKSPQQIYGSEIFLVLQEIGLADSAISVAMFARLFGARRAPRREGSALAPAREMEYLIPLDRLTPGEIRGLVEAVEPAAAAASDAATVSRVAARLGVRGLTLRGRDAIDATARELLAVIGRRLCGIPTDSRYLQQRECFGTIFFVNSLSGRRETTGSHETDRSQETAGNEFESTSGARFLKNSNLGVPQNQWWDSTQAVSIARSRSRRAPSAASRSSASASGR